MPRCQVDEFPMGDLVEGQINVGTQLVRLVNGLANWRQGIPL